MKAAFDIWSFLERPVVINKKPKTHLGVTKFVAQNDTKIIRFGWETTEKIPNCWLSIFQIPKTSPCLNIYIKQLNLEVISSLAWSDALKFFKTFKYPRWNNNEID